MNKILKYSLLSLLGVFAVACADDFLDKMPDSRTMVDSKTKVRKLLVSAYPQGGSSVFTELASDNIVDEGEANPNVEDIYIEMAYWKDMKRTSNDDTKSYWENCYNAIANANLALESIEKLKGKDFQAEKGEALIARAYAHFCLVNIFAKHYNIATADKDLGIAYMTKGETALNPKYQRNSVADVYKKIEADIEAGLPLISDEIYEQPRYHFNKAAANAFAARFYLYYGKWEKAVKCANEVADKGLIDWAYLGSLSTRINFRAKALINDKASLLLIPDVSNAEYIFGPWYECARINHTNFIAERETGTNKMPWGQLDPKSSYNSPLFVINGNPNFSKTIFAQVPRYFEYTDPVAKIGYARTVYNVFTVDEALLVRAEANIHLGNYNEALADLNAWTRNYFKNAPEVTMQQVMDFYDNIPYSEPSADGLTQKKKLNPVYFTVKDKEHENMLHYVLQCRRLLTMHSGLRWYDVKRMGIEVPRLQKQKTGEYKLIETLVLGDNRRAIQLPSDVIASGLEPNPR